ncbi:MAG: universal stress protein [Bacteroidota bacterium]
MKNILVPVDFSEVSEAAAQFAIDLAKKKKASITLLNSTPMSFVGDYPFPTYSGADVWRDEVITSIINQMARMIEDLETESIQIQSKVSSLGLVPAILDQIKKEEVDLVVMGTNGASGLDEFLIGSNTEKVVRQVHCPVISVPSSTSVDDINKILIPIDLREIRSSFLLEIAGLQDFFNCELEFLWVKTPHNVENEEKVTQELSLIFKKHGIEDYRFIIVRSVFPGDGILMETDASGANMVAMATHARRGISHWLSGSLSEDTINHVHVPVWTFKINRNEEVIALKSSEAVGDIPAYRKIEPMVYQ